MWRLLRESASELVRHRGAAYKIFLLVPLTFAALWLIAMGCLLAFGRVEFDPNESTVKAILFFGGLLSIFSLLVICVSRNVVAWHRQIVLNEQQGWTLPWPDNRSIRYGWRILACVLGYILVHVGCAFVWQFGILATFFSRDGHGSYAEWMVFLTIAFRPFGTLALFLAPILGRLIIMTLYVAIFGRLLLSLPNVAVAGPGFKIRGSRIPFLRRRFMVALFTIYALPVVYEGIELFLLIYWRYRPAEFPIWTSIASIMIGVLSFLWSVTLISVVYRHILTNVEGLKFKTTI